VDKNSSPLPEAVSPAECGQGLLQTFAASLFALAAGLAAVGHATDYGRSFTTETLRRNEVARAPRAIPNLPVRDASGHVATLRHMLASDGRIQIVDFVYTRCQTVCTSLGSIYQQLQQQLLDQGLQERIGLLSISFDPASDDAAALQAYTSRMRMASQAWRVVALSVPADRRRLLDAFGIMVVPAALGEFEHNAALHIVTADGRLVRIVDIQSPAEAIAVVRGLAQVTLR
jgi:protein SCO1/2